MGDHLAAQQPALGESRALEGLRSRLSRDLIAPLAAFGGVTALGATEGGYFAESWGWAALATLWISALGLLLRSGVQLGGLEIAILTGLVGLIVWTAVSVAWSASASQTVLEAERGLVYVGGLLAFLVLAGRRSTGWLLGALLTAIVSLSIYGLATRLFPERLGTFDPIAGYRLSEPLGYWNALGIFAAMGALLALGIAARGHSLIGRALAAASLVPLVATVYFTFGRGPWIALAVGLLAAIMLDPRRLQLITTLLVTSPAPALAVWLASRSEALTRIDAPLAQASREGHRLALTIVLLAALGAGTMIVQATLEHRVGVGRRARRMYALVLMLTVAGALSAVFIRYGSPPTLVQKAYDAFKAPPPATGGDLGKRLFNFSGSGRSIQWSVAWDNYQAHPWLGSGAGTYEQAWMERRPVAGKVRDAHSLYVETLAELGPFGLALLLATLAVPVAAAVKVRSYRLAPVAFGAYSAYLVHASVDWDWEMPAVTLAALFCGAALLVRARRDGAKPLSPRVRGGVLAAALALSALAFVGVIGNSALAASREALFAGRWDDAEAEARKAIGWAPWSSQPWEYLANAQIGQGERAAARSSLLTAISKDERNWKLWLSLALVSTGQEREQALARATSLNPRSPEIADLRPILTSEQSVVPLEEEG